MSIRAYFLVYVIRVYLVLVLSFFSTELLTGQAIYTGEVSRIISRDPPLFENLSFFESHDGVLHLIDDRGLSRLSDGERLEQTILNGLQFFTESSSGVVYMANAREIAYSGNSPLENILPHIIPAPDRERFSGLTTSLDEVYLSTCSAIYMLVSDSLMLLSKAKNTRFFSLSGKTFAWIPDSGLYRLNKKKITPVALAGSLAGSRINSLVALAQKWFVFLDNGEFFSWSGKHWTKTGSLKLSAGDTLVKALPYLDSLIVVATKNADVHILDCQGKYSVMQKFLPEGLSSPVRDMFVGKRGDIFILNPFSVDKINIYPLRYHLKEGIDYQGKIIHINTNEKSAIFTTTKGWFIFREGRVIDQTRRDNLLGSISFGKEKFFVHPGGIVKITQEKELKLLSQPITGFRESQHQSGIVYLFNSSSLTVFSLVHKGIIKEIDLSPEGVPRSIEEDVLGNLWLMTRQGDIYRVSPGSPPLPLIEKIHERVMDDDFSLLLSDGNHCFLSNASGLTALNGNNFATGVHMINNLQGFHTGWTRSIHSISRSNWLLSRSTAAGPHSNPIHALYLIDSSYVKVPPLTKLITLAKNPVVHVSKQKDLIWIADEKYLLAIDTSMFGLLPDSPVSVTIGKISCGKNQIIYNENFPSGSSGLDIHKPIRFKDTRMGLLFQFYTSKTGLPGSLHYFTKLSNGKDEWTEWIETGLKEYHNLPSGKYKFQVTVFDFITGQMSPGPVVQFVILKPLYAQWWAYLIYFIVVISGVWFYIYSRITALQREKKKLEEIITSRTRELMWEKEKSEALIANLLPKKTADELKLTGKASSQKYSLVTVLFSDIQGFSKIAEQMNPEALVDQLDNFFFHFDSVVEKYNIEKIKTIGDAYMCAGGIPRKNRTNPVEVILAALEMQLYMKEMKQYNDHIWDLRIGIHTGPLIAGVVGHKKLSYDIWGDTVNTASRMEASGEVGKVNISGNTYELVRNFFICEYRGKMPVKYKGDVDMYFVKGIRPELSVNLKGLPNKKFHVQLQFLRLNDLEEYIFNYFESDTPEYLKFHNLKNTIDVYTHVELLGRAEGVSDEELLLLRTAALFVNVGYLTHYEEYKIKRLEFATRVLPDFHYTTEQIQGVLNLLQIDACYAHDMSLLGQIMCDAMLNYTGRIDYLNRLDDIYKELSILKKVKKQRDFYENQIRFLLAHHFHTATARYLQDIRYEDQIAKMNQLMNNF
jgi:adenylate cyclase